MTKSVYVLALTALLAVLSAAGAGKPKATTQPAAASPAKNRAEAVGRFRDMKFGLFVHWGAGSMSGQELSWARKRGGVPHAVYDSYYKKFNPTKFNADEWVKVAKDAGMKYIVFTAKHHDGFANFDTKVSDYKITGKDCPFKRDVCKELADACKRGGLMLGFYYSQRDWVSPLFNGANYRGHSYKYIFPQIEELCTKYGDVGVIWFDAKGPFPAKYWDSHNLFKLIRKHQPAALINSRCGLPGDFESVENRVGKYNRRRLWETCSKLGSQWGWKPNDKIHPLNLCIRVLVEIVGNDGNWLLNVGPRPDGMIEPAQAARLKEIGDWLRANGESIYGTRGGPYRGTYDWRTTCKGNTIYLHVLKWPEESESIVMGPMKRKVVRASVLGGGKTEVKQTDKAVTVTVPKADRKPMDTIIKLELDGRAFDAR